MITHKDLEDCFYKKCSAEHKKYVLEYTKPVNQRKVVEAGWKQAGVMMIEACAGICERMATAEDSREMLRCASELRFFAGQFGGEPEFSNFLGEKWTTGGHEDGLD